MLDAPVCVHVTREPLEVARSMHQRDGFPLQSALGLWELYTVRAVEASAGMPRLLVRYEPTENLTIDASAFVQRTDAVASTLSVKAGDYVSTSRAQ